MNNQNPFSSAAISRAFFGVLLAFLCIGSTNVFAQSFDMEKYLRGKDVNGNERVEPEEMSSNTKRIISGAGLNPEKTYKIGTIVKYVNKKNGVTDKSKTSSARSQAERKVPGFGVDKSDDAPMSPFGSGATGSTAKVSESVTKSADGIMNRYDRNKNGSLDSDEIKVIKWGSPDPRQSDLNKDGRISRTELIRRLAARETQSSSSSRSYSSSSSSRDSAKRKEDAERRSKEREKYKSSSRTSSSSSSYRSPSSRSSYSRSTPSSSSSSTSTKSSETPKVDRAKYEKYATSVIKSYDKDNDGKLNKDELKKMRRPPAGADVDKDGFVSKEELLDNLMGPKTSSTASASTASSSKSDTKKSYRSSRTSRSSSSRSSSFEDMDADKDKQVEMHEYSSEWNDEIVDAFYKIDRNADGVITLMEWSARER